MNTHYAIATLNSGKELLVYAVGGTFASDAWIKNDGSFDKILGRSFLAVTSDDGKVYNVGRNVRRPTTEEIKDMPTCPLFRLQVELREKPIKKDVKVYRDSHIFFEVLPNLMEEYSEEDIREYFNDNLLAK